MEEIKTALNIIRHKFYKASIFSDEEANQFYLKLKKLTYNQMDMTKRDLHKQHQ